MEPGAGVDERGVPALEHAAGVPEAAAQRRERVPLGVGPRQREHERQRQGSRRPRRRSHAGGRIGWRPDLDADGRRRAAAAAEGYGGNRSAARTGRETSGLAAFLSAYPARRWWCGGWWWLVEVQPAESDGLVWQR